MAASLDGSLTLFKNGGALKTVKLRGKEPLVRYINGEIVTAARYGKLTILNEDLQVLKTFHHGSESYISSLTGNSEHIVLGDHNGTVRYYDRVGGIFPRVRGFIKHRGLNLQVYYHGKEIFSIDVYNEVLVSGSKDYKVQVWNMTSGSQLFEVAHDNQVWCVKVVDEMIVSCGDKTVRIWNLKNSKLLHKLQLPGGCRNFDLNSERTVLAVAHHIGVSIWDFQNLIQIMEIELNDVNVNGVNDVRFNMHGTRLIFGQFDGQITKVSLDVRTTVPTTQISTIKRPLPTSFR